ncbi:glycosyltransferase, partial [bacterium]|nr:glycosyltransferase [bacterium]
NHSDAEYNFRVIRIERGSFKPFRFLQTVWQIIKTGWNSDILFVNGLGLESAIAKRIIRKPMVCKIVGDVAWERARNKGMVNDTIDEFQLKKYSLGVEMLKKLRSFYVRNSDIVLTPSQYLADIVNGWGVSHQRIHVVYNALEMANLPRLSRENLRSKLELSGNVILTVARLVPWKGIDKIIEVVSAIDEITLVVVGDGPLESNLKELSVNLGCSARVRFTSRISRKEVYEYMLASDVFVLNSTYEGLPHVVIEAMSCGIPVIATNAGGTPEIVKDRETGLIIEPNNNEQLKKAIDCLLKDGGLRDRLVENARKQLSKFSWSHLVEETLAIIGLFGNNTQ